MDKSGSRPRRRVRTAEGRESEGREGTSLFWIRSLAAVDFVFVVVVTVVRLLFSTFFLQNAFSATRTQRESATREREGNPLSLRGKTGGRERTLCSSHGAGIPSRTREERGGEDSEWKVIYCRESTTSPCSLPVSSSGVDDRPPPKGIKSFALPPDFFFARTTTPRRSSANCSSSASLFCSLSPCHWSD